MNAPAARLRPLALLAALLALGACTAEVTEAPPGTTAPAPRGLKHAVLGDGLVTVASAFGEHPDPALALGVPAARWPAFLFVCALTVVWSIVGDLFESLIKRHANAKDSGDLFPGHGGMFDRLDSVFAALPVWASGLALLDL